MNRFDKLKKLSAKEPKDPDTIYDVKIMKGEKGDQGNPGINGLNGKDGKDGLPGAKGKQGIPGIKGDKGDKGDSGQKGDKGLIWRGQWKPSTKYSPDDVVYSVGSSYVCTKAHTAQFNSEPGAGMYFQEFWDLVALKGDTGIGGGGTSAPASSGGGGTWGSIIGTLSDQTDLQTALDAKAISSATSVDNTIARYDGTNNKTIQGSLISINDSGDLSLPDNRFLYVDNVYSKSVNDINIVSSATSDAFPGTNVSLNAGINGGAGDGGNILLNVGTSVSGGNNGQVKLLGSGGYYMGINASAVAASDKTLTIRNASGTLALTSDIDDTVYGSGWNADTTHAPSKNAVYDKIESLSAGGQTTFNAIVASSGGDYTTLSAAIAAASAGWTIFVKPGTYSEGGWTSSLANISIVGLDAGSTVLNFTTNSIAHTGANLAIRGVTMSATTGKLGLNSTDLIVTECVLTKSGATNNGIECSAANARFVNNKIVGSSATTDNIITLNLTGAKLFFSNNYVESATCSTSGNLCAVNFGANSYIINNRFHINNGASSSNNLMRIEADCLFESNQITRSGTHTGALIVTGGSNIVFNGNHMVSTTSNGIRLQNASNNYGVVTGNYFQCAISIYSPNNCDYWKIVGNHLYGSSGNGAITINGTTCANWVISGNYIEGAAAGSYGITASTGSGHVIVGNSFSTNMTTPYLDGNNYQIIMRDNIGLPDIYEIKSVRAKNTSGGTIAAGAIVVLKAVANGYEVTTTTTAGDNKVYGVSCASMSSNAFGYIQVAGFTNVLKVDGTTDIAIGDFISCFTTAGIGQKASAGHTVIAIAQEAYTTDNSSGVIDALIITPRLI